MALGLDQPLDLSKFSVNAYTKYDYNEKIELSLVACNTSDSVGSQLLQAIHVDAEPGKYNTLLCFKDDTDLTLFGNRRFPSYQVVEIEIKLVKTQQPSAQVLPSVAIVLPDTSVDYDLISKSPYYTDYKVVWEGSLTL